MSSERYKVNRKVGSGQDHLQHSGGYKYIKREWKNGRWNYTYPEDEREKRRKNVVYDPDYKLEVKRINQEYKKQLEANKQMFERRYKDYKSTGQIISESYTDSAALRVFNTACQNIESQKQHEIDNLIMRYNTDLSMSYQELLDGYYGIIGKYNKMTADVWQQTLKKYQDEMTIEELRKMNWNKRVMTEERIANEKAHKEYLGKLYEAKKNSTMKSAAMRVHYQHVKDSGQKLSTSNPTKPHFEHQHR